MKGKDFFRMSVLSGAVVLAALLSSCNKEEQGYRIGGGGVV